MMFLIYCYFQKMALRYNIRKQLDPDMMVLVVSQNNCLPPFS